mmetsp:Transcript_11132/g.35317  ORF Transcript_11132/g.35317 Transcript_11132/m.35317 type:complete len:309 (-) Transcript_11132:40-966(-)
MPAASAGAARAPYGRVFLVGGAVLAATKAAVHRGQGCAFVPAPTVGRGGGLDRAKAVAAERLLAGSLAAGAGAGASWPSLWSLAAGMGALAAGGLRRGGRPKPATPVALGLVPSSAEEPLVAMATAGGRRKRLGVGGRVCMLTGRKKKKVIRRSFSEKANKRYLRPNTRWKRLWWEREKKWIRLYVSCRAIRKVDTFGLETMARRAGLDLYAWAKPHWLPGSRQDLCLKVGYTGKARRDIRLWPDHIDKLNKGAALADITPAREPTKPKAFRPRPWTRVKGPGTPTKVPAKPLEASKVLRYPPGRTLL